MESYFPSVEPFFSIELVETLFTVIYALEVIVKIIVLGWRKYIEATKNVFDFTITILAVVSTVIVYYPNEFSDSRIIRMIVMARVLRLVRLLTAMKRFQLLGRITIEIIPDAVPIVGKLMCKIRVRCFPCRHFSFCFLSPFSSPGKSPPQPFFP